MIFGHVSGGLASRDFDDAAAYHRWADQRPALASTLPTVATQRGFHVYGWLVPLPDGDLPTVDLCDAGFFEIEVDSGDARFHRCNTEHTDNTSNRGEEKRRSEDAETTPESTTPSLVLTAEEAIQDSLPSGPGQRHKLVFEFARRLKAVPNLADQPGRGLRRYVQAWHRRAIPIIGTKPFEETWIDFLKAWERVRHPYGGGVVSVAFERACHVGLPDVAGDYEQSEILLLAGLCRELQRGVGEEPFYLSCRDAGRLLGVTHVQASRWLFLLVADDVLEEVEKGDVKTRRASQHRYLGPMD